MNVINGAAGMELVEVSLQDVADALEYVAKKPESRTLFLSRRNTEESLVDALVAHPTLEGVRSLSIMADANNLRLFERCKWLYALNFGFDSSIFDFTEFVSLGRLGGVWSKRWKGLDKCALLSDLHLSKFAGKVGELPSIVNLERLTLIQSSIADLKGLELAQKLRYLELSLCSKLVSVAGVENLSSHLEELVLNGCRKISDYGEFSALKRLRRMAITESAKLQSLSFLDALGSLEFLNIFETAVETKDLSPCLECLSLKEFRCEPRRGYQPPVTDVIQTVCARSEGGVAV